MSGSGFGPELERAAGDAAARGGDLVRLKELLLGPERRALDAAQQRIESLERAERELPRRLPGALEAAARGDGAARVAAALAEPVAQALGAAVQRDRHSLIDALFPIIGPLIRKSIAEALRNLVADLNAAVESSFTLHGLKWRLEAWRAGVPYAHVVLKHRLAYRIEHVFLIDAASGLVIDHEAAPDLPALDADAIAGMLTALGDFVGDSVGRAGGGALESVRVGEYLVWVVPGPRANLACFMRGVPPGELRALLEQRLEEVHERLAAIMAGGARAEAPPWRELLDPPTLQRAVGAEPDAPAAAPSRWPLLIVLVAVLALLATFAAGRERWNARVDALRARLVAHPGFVLTGIDARPWRELVVHGLLDADAEPLAPLLAGFDGVRTRLDAAGYVSGDDAVVERRARRLLAPPDGVRIAVRRGVLRLDGRAPADWIARAGERAGWIAGVARSELALTPELDAAVAARAELERLAADLAARPVVFVDDVRAADGADARVDELAGAVRRAQALAASAHVGLALVAVGTNDAPGSDAINRRVRLARARWLADALAARGVADAIDTGEDARGERRGAYLRLAIGAPR
ncbi:MAG TPA: hypothetical protein VGC30_05325 [Dokdonella sp.]